MVAKIKMNREETIEWLLSHTIIIQDECMVLPLDFWSCYIDEYPAIYWNGRKIRICRLIAIDDLHSDMVTRHRCHRKPCINPDHLMEGTVFENAKDNHYKPFEMPIHHDWWDDPSDEQLEKEYRKYEEEMEEELQEDWA